MYRQKKYIRISSGLELSYITRCICFRLDLYPLYVYTPTKKINKTSSSFWNVIYKRASVGKFLSEEKKERGHKNPSQSYVTVGGKLKKVQNTQIGSGSTDRSCRGFWVINSNRDRNVILYYNRIHCSQS